MGGIGVFGGTFDPLHVGHVVVALWVKAALQLDRVELVVANEPWQKLGKDSVTGDVSAATKMVAPQHRLAMVEAVVDGMDGLVASSIEIDRGGSTYTVETLEAYRDAYPSCGLFLIVGSDVAAEMDTWYRWTEVAELAEVVVVDRPGMQTQRLSLPCQMVWCPALQVSSSQVRQWAQEGKPLDGLVPAQALAYCRQEHLYGF
ncbi:MAG: nicotinate (nicotinamide) nucleotide adenylyltransferase [Acidimicrobiia bacterium]|nr:nicotinate (nicotinamide) nucleotide adenylyltransferase [Acidimicrobiia bacterium]MYC58130.1 nicotinate (nicotinamide) nucleotide adenylyltransferase [Acidimicrobiia bacterium]MYG94380.1 nicotinate (nicotinamide) nucleotide adenylyltransferase [Acidimicrobiia bacterium]MYI30562.1 nicotinate (nicotinamide) nucleotide adenylyltransferase [Acidimicrobiia bacterium]